MGTSLTGLTPSTTYDALIKVGDNGALSATSKYIGDGLGNDSVLSLSTTNVGIGTDTPPSLLSLVQTIALAAGATNPRIENIAYTINNSGAQTGTATGIFLNATETALNGQTHNLMALQVGGTNKFIVKNTGEVVSASNISATTGGYLGWEARSAMRSITDGRIVLYNFALSGFDLLQFGGTTSSFPAIKRNGTAIDFRLADDSAYCSVTGQEVGANVGFFAPNSTELRGTYLRARASTFIGFADSTQGIVIDSSATTPSASSILQANSTTKGFLPPRMTTAQRDAIASPAAGLMIYNTTTAKLNVYTTAWEAITSS